MVLWAYSGFQEFQLCDMEYSDLRSIPVLVEAVLDRWGQSAPTARVHTSLGQRPRFRNPESGQG